MIRVTMILADHAEVADNKLFINGGGWTHCWPNPTPPIGLAILVYVPYDQTNKPHKIQLILVDEDGASVVDNDEQTIQVFSELEVGRPPGTKPGHEQIAKLAINMGPMTNLEAGRGYRWEARNDRGEIMATAAFRTHAQG